MITYQSMAGTSPVCNQFVSESGFDAARLSALVANRNNRFHLDLSNHTLIGVLEAYATFKRRSSPRFNNNAVIGAIRHLQDALKLEIGSELMPIDVTDIFYDEFKLFLMSRPSPRGGHIKPSTIQNYFDHIRAALTWGAMHRCPVSETFRCYKVESYELTKVVLSTSQIAHIYYYDIDGNKDKIKKILETYPIRGFSFANLHKVKDQFCFEANTAQRYSDASRISEENFNENHTVMRVTQQKTGGKASVNIMKYAIDKKIVYEILKKYNYKSPAFGMAISNFNRLLHLLLQSIGGEFLEPVLSENKINGTIVSERIPKWKLIASHTARRTFVSYHIKHGKNLLQIQRCTGHKDLRSIQAYSVLEKKKKTNAIKSNFCVI
ncbi:MAG: tyrosine-type recombinase/integrase [Paludibacteraceae bacterium]|nr:tyrosine-type recombinase/integrase [Paludibacteraceae bacterium]